MKSNKNIKKVFKTKWFSIDEIPIKPSSGEPYYRVSYGKAVGILAVTNDAKIILIRQFRPAIGVYALEIPAGAIDDGESPEVAAKRELLEEAGFMCDSMENIGLLEVSPDRINCEFNIFFGKGAKINKGIKNEEGIEVLLVSKNEFENLIKDGKILSCGTISVYLLAKLKDLL